MVATPRGIEFCLDNLVLDFILLILFGSPLIPLPSHSPNEYAHGRSQISGSSSISLIASEYVRDWVEDLTINKTAEGLIIQEMILKHVADKKNQPWRTATPEEESRSIDGYIGEVPVQIKPTTYQSQRPIIHEIIEVETIYYKKTQKYLRIFVRDGSPLQE